MGESLSPDRRRERSRSREDRRRHDSSDREEEPRKRRHDSSEKEDRRKRRHDSEEDRRLSPEKQKKTDRPRSKSKDRPKDTTEDKVVKAPAKKKDDLLGSKTGGAYIPPAKLRMMQQNITDKNSEAFQRLAWEALKKSINGLINKVNSPNIAVIVRELFAENIVRGRGLLCQSIIQVLINFKFWHQLSTKIFFHNSNSTNILQEEYICPFCLII